MATILIVDEPAVSIELTAMLRHTGHRVLAAAEGARAREVLRSERPDLVIAEILAPEPSGLEFVEQLHAERRLVRPRLIFLSSGFVQAEARALAQHYRVSGLVAKPVEPAALLAAIDAALGERAPSARQPRADPARVEASLRRMAKKLYRRLAELEQLNARLIQRVDECAGQLEIARSALGQEVTKRIWAEHELTAANFRLQDEVIRDALTGLHNRRYLEETLGRETSRARRSEQPFGVMMIDVDRFKHYNDAYGHAVGDAVLRAVSQHMLSMARGEDIVCRCGGDEFVVVMAQASVGTVLERAEKLRVGAQRLEVECSAGLVGPVTLSVGVAMFPDHGDTAQAVLLAADAALYRAKQAGRNRVVEAIAPEPAP